MCRSDHGYSIACKRSERGRRWSVTCGFSSAGHTLSRIANNCSSSIPHASCRQGTKGVDLLLQHNANKKKRPEPKGLWPLLYVCCGGVLLSHNLSVAVPLALPGLASRFGMEAGRFPGAMTTTRLGVQHCPPLLVGVWVDRGLYSGCGCFACLFCCSPVGWGVV